MKEDAWALPTKPKYMYLENLNCIDHFLKLKREYDKISK